MIDQAYKLREYYRTKKNCEESQSKIISITSGKGGTGKSYIAFYLSQLFASQGYKTLLVEFDFNLGSLALQLGLEPKNTLFDFFEGKILFDDLHESITENFFVIFGDNGKLNFPQNNISNIHNFFSFINKRRNEFDVIILDNGAGISREIFETISYSTLNLLVTLPDPVAIMDAYVVMKMMTKNSISTPNGIIINRCKTQLDGETAFENLRKATAHFLNTDIEYIGAIREDNHFRGLRIFEDTYAKNPENRPFLTDLFNSVSTIATFNQMANNNQTAQQTT